MTKRETDAEPEKGERLDALHKLVQPSPELAEVVGERPLARSEVVGRMWEYIKRHKLQVPEDGRRINADDRLRPIFGKDQISMFEMNKRISEHLS